MILDFNHKEEDASLQTGFDKAPWMELKAGNNFSHVKSNVCNIIMMFTICLFIIYTCTCAILAYWDGEMFKLMETQPRKRAISQIIPLFHERDQDFGGNFPIELRAICVFTAQIAG